MRRRILTSGLFDEERLRALAGPETFETAVELFGGERMHGIRLDSDGIRGTVRDGIWREAWIGLTHDRLAWTCECTPSPEPRPCAHSVALALEAADVERRETFRTRLIALLLPIEEEQPLRLPSLSMEALTGLLRQSDAVIQAPIRHLDSVRSNDAAGRERALELLDVVLEKIRTRGNLDFNGYHELYSRSCEVVEALARVAREIPPQDLVQVLETAIASIEIALGSVDDSEGGLGYVLGELCEQHRVACGRGGLDPASLGARLASWQIGSAFDVFQDGLLVYGKVLGPRGLEAYEVALSED